MYRLFGARDRTVGFLGVLILMTLKKRLHVAVLLHLHPMWVRLQGSTNFNLELINIHNTEKPNTARKLMGGTDGTR